MGFQYFDKLTSSGKIFSLKRVNIPLLLPASCFKGYITGRILFFFFERDKKMGVWMCNSRIR